MTETLDASQYLKRGEPVINSFRASKGDMDGKVSNGRIAIASVIDKTIVGNLVERGFIESYQKDLALDLMELRNALFGALNAKTSLSLFINGGDKRVSRDDATSIYETVVRAIKRNGERIIVHACTTDYEKDTAAKTINGITVYVQQFNKLTKAMDDAIAGINKDVA